MTVEEITEILRLDADRRTHRRRSYDPVTGCAGHSWRVARRVAWEIGEVYLPRDMVDDPAFATLSGKLEYKALRCRYDFEYWAATCVKIFHKISCREVPFVLNSAQRILLDELERQRRIGRPIRVILLKARQWGGSTLVQVYMTWIQLLHHTHWNSIICSQTRNTSGQIRSNIRNILTGYPEELWPYDCKPGMKPWESSDCTRVISGTESTVTITSTFSPDAVRGLPFSMAHLSEVAFWKSGDVLSPEEFIRSVTGGIAMVADTLIIMESTANGTGNFFHSQWTAAVSGRSSFVPVFVPWYEIEMNRIEPPDPEAFVADWTGAERRLWDIGLSLDQIYWYRQKALEATSHLALCSEFPTTAEEAFAATDRSVFDSEAVERLRGCCHPERRLVEIVADRPDLRWMLSPPGRDSRLSVWSLPPKPDRRRLTPPNRYVVAVDVGGRTAASDYSVITVMDRLGCAAGHIARVAAQWRGHADHDLMARYAEQIARAYGDALLIIESNTLESAPTESSQYLLEQLNDRYPNLYVRQIRDRARDVAFETRVGFHTNRATKAAIIANMIRVVRDGLYEENSHDTLNEMLVYEVDSAGCYAAKRGYHDDQLITRAIALYVIDTLPPLTPLHRYDRLW